MATAKSRASQGMAPGEPGIVYGKRDNIKVPNADNADATVVTTADSTDRYPESAAARETDRHKSPNTVATSTQTPYAPDAADYIVRGSERTTN